MKDSHNTDFAELQSLLRAEADQVPHCDLGEGFLDDFHNRLKADSKGLQKRSWFNKISLPQIPPLAWGGAVAATIMLGVFLGLSVKEGSKLNGLAATEKAQESLVYVSFDERVGFSGTMPAFETKPLEF